MPQQDPKHNFPLAWSSKRTVQCMRRLGIITPIDDALIDQAATEFVSNSIEKTPFKESLNSAVTLRASENTPKNNGSSLEAGPPTATRQSNIGGSTVCQGDNTLENPAHQGVIRYDDNVTIAKDGDEYGASRRAVSLNQRKTSQHAAERPDYPRRTTVRTLLEDGAAESATKKENSDAIKWTEMLEHDNGSDNEMVMCGKFGKTRAKSLMPEIAKKEKKAPQISRDFQDVGYDADTEGSTVGGEIPLAGRLPLSAEDVMLPTVSDNACSHSDHMSLKSAKRLMTGEDPSMQVSQNESIANLSIAEVKAVPDEAACVGTEREKRLQRNSVATDISSKDQDSEDIANTRDVEKDQVLQVHKI